MQHRKHGGKRGEFKKKKKLELEVSASNAMEFAQLIGGHRLRDEL